MMAKIHEVKLHAKYFDLVLEGKKRAEFRKNDRNYERGDTLILHEWVQGVFTGRKVEARITDVTDLSDWLEDYVLLSIELLNTGAYEIVNWKELSERGLVFRINHEIMHQLGLAVMYESVKWSTKTGHRVRVFSSIDFPIRLVVTHHYIRAVLVRCNIQRYSPLLRELHR